MSLSHLFISVLLKCSALTKVLYTMEKDLIPMGRSLLSFGSAGYTEENHILSWSRWGDSAGGIDLVERELTI